MKKILFLLLFTVSFYGQTLQNPTFGIVTEKTNATDSAPAYFTTSQVDGVHKKTPAANVEKTANKSDSYTVSSSTTYASTKALVDGLAVKNWIKSNESLALAQRKGDVLYGILDQYTGEEITLSKVTGTPTVDGVIYFQLGAEYFKRDFSFIRPEWFGAVGYDKKVITNTVLNYVIAGLIDSTSALQNCINTAISSGVRNIHFSRLYYTTNQLTVNPYVGSSFSSDFGFQITGEGDNTGIIYKKDDATKSVITINTNTSNISQYINLKNFAIYLSSDVGFEYKAFAGIYMNECIRTTFEDLLITGGSYAVENGLYTVHSELNNNIFLNVFNRCKGFNTGSKGNGLHYKHVTYQPTLQTITNCAFQQLGGCAIVADILPNGAGGFGGLIQGNELEGNSKGAINLSAISGLTVNQNYFELGNFDDLHNLYPTLPKSPFTFGITAISGSNYECVVDNLTFTGNTSGAGTGDADYAIIFCGNNSGNSSNVQINNNILSSQNTTRFISNIGFCTNVEIKNNKFGSNGLGTPTISGLPFIVSTSQYDEVIFENDKIDCSFNTIRQNKQFKKTRGIYNKGLVQSVGGYPYPIPIDTSYAPEFIKDEIVTFSDLGEIYKCKVAGKLHYNTSAVFVNGSADVTCGGAVWNWQIGEQVNSPYLVGGTGIITNKVGNVFTLSTTANTSITDWLLDAILLPLNRSMLTEPTTSVGTYDILTRNTSTGVVEKVLSNTIAMIASPALTGTPTAPTAAAGANTTQIATTAFVQANARPYKVYTALLSQSGTSAPTATVLENTLGGTVVWTRNSTGQYFGTLSTAFVSDKTFCLTGGNTNNDVAHSTTQRNNDNAVVVESYYSGAKTDGVLNKTAIEIRVYN